MPESSLKTKTVKGTVWSAIDNGARYIISFIVSIVLSRLLCPDDYGLIGLTAIFTAICDAMINAGFTNALIRKNNATNEDYNTVFIINLVVSILLYLLIFFCAPLIADFFDRSELVALIRVSSLGMVIGAISIVQQTQLTKKINFKSLTKISLAVSVVSGILGIILALCGFGVWALVFHQLLATILRSALLWFTNKWIPNFHFYKASFYELFGFGWKMMIARIIDSVWKELTQLVIGKFYNPASLGQYMRSKHYGQLFSSNLTDVIQRVTYPVLSSMQEEKGRMLSAYRRIIKITMYLSCICLFILGAVSEPMIFCINGTQWGEAAKYLPWICLTMSLYPLHAINLNMLQVQGRSVLFLGLEIIKKVIAVVPLLIGTFISIYWMLVTNVITGIISFFINSHFSGKLLGYTSFQQIKDIAPIWFLAMFAGGSVYFLIYIPISYYIILPIQLITALGLVVGISKITHNYAYEELKAIFQSYIGNLSKKRAK